MQSLEAKRAAICARDGVLPDSPSPCLKAGVALSTLGRQPINGLRHRPDSGTSGWFLWAGEEPSTAPDFFQPLHVHHLAEQWPEVLPYLALPPGWRFLVAPGYDDVWFDVSLLDV
jgi:hypothetical protein